MSTFATPMLVIGSSAADTAITKPNKTQHAIFMGCAAIGRSNVLEEKREVAPSVQGPCRSRLTKILYLSVILPIIALSHEDPGPALSPTNQTPDPHHGLLCRRHGRAGR